MTELLEGWSEFNVAMAGATAALAGLIIVAMSVNIERILKAPSVASRGAAAIASLTLAILACGIGLVPGQPEMAYGWELVLLAVVAAIFAVRASVNIVRLDGGPPGWRGPKIAVGLVGPLCYLAAGILVLVDAGGSGLALAAIGCLAAIVSGVVFAWVALVELLR